MEKLAVIRSWLCRVTRRNGNSAPHRPQLRLHLDTVHAEQKRALDLGMAQGLNISAIPAVKPAGWPEPETTNR